MRTRQRCTLCVGECPGRLACQTRSLRIPAENSRRGFYWPFYRVQPAAMLMPSTGSAKYCGAEGFVLSQNRLKGASA